MGFMIKKIVLAIMSIALVIGAIYALKHKSFYTPEQLDVARKKAVSQARNGDYTAALRRLKVLSRYDTQNPILWFDYLTILQWADEQDTFFHVLGHADFSNPPDYFLKACVALVKKIKGAEKLTRINQLFHHLMQSKKVLHSPFLQKLYAASLESNTNKVFLNNLKIADAQHPLIQQIHLDEMSAIAREGNLDEALRLFEQEYDEQKNNFKFMADYLTVLNWAQEHWKVVELSENYPKETLPIYAVEKIAESLFIQESYDTAIEYYRYLFSKNPNNLYYNNQITAIKDQKIILQEKKIRAQPASQSAKAKQNFAGDVFLLLSDREIFNRYKQHTFSKKLYQRWLELNHITSKTSTRKKLAFYQQNLPKLSKDSLFYYDYLVLLSWSGKHQLALKLYKQKKQRHLSLATSNKTTIKTACSLQCETKLGLSYYYKSLARSAKNIKDLTLAHDLYAKALTIEPENVETMLAQANLLQEMKKPQKAIDLLEKIKPKDQNTAVLFSLASAYRQKGNSLFALQFYDKILLKNPKYSDAFYQKAVSLIESEMYFLAYDIVKQQKNLLSSVQKADILGGINTYKVRNATDDYNKTQQIKSIDEALDFNQIYLSFLQKQVHDDKKIAYAYADRITLLHLAKKYQLVIDLYENTKISLPNYALNAVASSALALKKPKYAAKITKQVLANSQKDNNAKINAYYAYLELEDFDEAYAYLDKIDKENAPWLYSQDGKALLSNAKKKEVLLLKAMHIAYKNTLGEALVAVEQLLNKAPMNSNYRFAYAKILRWRGWFDKAQKQLNILHNVDPEFLDAMAAQSRLFLEQKYYEAGRAMLNKLKHIQPLPDQVKVVMKEWDIFDTNIFAIHWKEAQAEGSRFSNKEQTLNASLYTKPINNNWRGFASYRKKYADFLDNKQEHITRQGLGINYRAAWGEGSLQVYNVEGISGLEYSLDGLWQVNDYFSLNGQYQSFSDDTPIRAFYADIYAKSVKFGGSYNPNEEYQYRLNLGIVDFTDTNRRRELALDAYQPLYRDEHHILSLWEYVYVQDNTLTENRPYFNPQSLFSTSLALDYTGIIRRSYDYVFTHSLRLGYGYSKQSNFSAKPFFDITYKHRWDFSRYFNLYYGIGFRQNYYDGLKENNPNYFAGLEYKF